MIPSLKKNTFKTSGTNELHTFIVRFHLVTKFRSYSQNRGEVAIHFAMFTHLLASVTIVATRQGFATDNFCTESSRNSSRVGKSMNCQPTSYFTYLVYLVHWFAFGTDKSTLRNSFPLYR